MHSLPLIPFLWAFLAGYVAIAAAVAVSTYTPRHKRHWALVSLFWLPILVITCISIVQAVVVLRRYDLD